MAIELHTDWLRALKVKDEVAVLDNGCIIGCKYSVRVIAKITPTGQIQLEGDKTKFNSRGCMPGNKYTHTKYIVELTPKVKDIIFRENFIDQLEDFLRHQKFNEMPIEKLKEIQKILES